MGFPITARFTAARLCSFRITPVGLLGELRITALVLGVISRPSAPSSIWKPVLLTSRGTVLPPAMVMMVSYREKAGTGTMTSSPGFRMPSRAVNSAWEDPTVTSTSSGVVGLPRPVS